MSKVAAVAVLYNCDDSKIKPMYESLARQVDRLYIVDNSDNGQDLTDVFTSNPKIEYISLGDNLGIAYAQNVGIKKAMDTGCDYVLLSDQDTVFPDDYVVVMLREWQSSPYTNIAAMGPDFADRNREGERQGFVWFNGIRNNRLYPSGGQVEVSQLIASGKMIDLSKISDIGLMDESLFIDWVDIEWCWRARAKGYKVVGCADVVISHCLGDYNVRIGEKQYIVRGAVRHYYIIRNAVYLKKYSTYINPAMRINLGYKTIRYLIGFTLLGKPRSKHFKYCIKGLHDGRHKIMGRIKL